MNNACFIFIILEFKYVKGMEYQAILVKEKYKLFAYREYFGEWKSESFKIWWKYWCREVERNIEHKIRGI